MDNMKLNEQIEGMKEQIKNMKHRLIKLKNMFLSETVWNGKLEEDLEEVSKLQRKRDNSFLYWFGSKEEEGLSPEEEFNLSYLNNEIDKINRAQENFDNLNKQFKELENGLTKIKTISNENIRDEVEKLKVLYLQKKSWKELLFQQ